jgi:hypothetical protein
MTPPNNVPAERHLLGVLIRENLAFPVNLKPSDFFEPKHHDVAAAILYLQSDGKPADEVTVPAYLHSVGSSVDYTFINDLTAYAGFGELRQEHIDMIADAAFMREASVIASKVTEPDALIEHYARLADKRKSLSPRQGAQRMPIDELMKFDRKADPTNVLGNRWLCRGGSLVMAGQAGTGKSALMMQAAINWTLGQDFFGIKTNDGMKMRTLVIQAENDTGDLAESMQDQVNGLYLDEDQKAELKDRMFIYRESVATGKEFGDVLRKLVIQHQATIVFVDPLMAFVGADISETAEAAKFLRHIIQPILNETGVIVVFMHHTGKPKSSKDKEGQTMADLAYQLFGSSEVTNWAREIACLQRCQGDEQIYRLGLTKRRSRAGMTDGVSPAPVGEIYIRHSPKRGEIRWVRSQPPVVDSTEGY